MEGLQSSSPAEVALTPPPLTTHNSNFDPTTPLTASTGSIPPPEVAKHIPCRFFAEGTCKYAENCAFSHAIISTNVVTPVAPAPGLSILPSMQQEYSQEAPVFDYGYMQHQQFSQGYYPSYPQFQPHHYPQHYVQPQHYYQQLPPQQMQPANQQPIPTPSEPSQVTSPNPDEAQAPSPYLQQQQQQQQQHPQQLNYPPFQPQFNGDFNSFGPDGQPIRIDRAQSAHTYFQGGPPQNFNQSYQKRLQLPRSEESKLGRPRFISTDMNGGGPRYTGPKPTCAFFTANRCRNRDGCAFPHILADGVDSRSLGMGIMGFDGRVDNPELTGGVSTVYSGVNKRNGMNRMNMMGGQQYMGPPRRRYEEEQRLNPNGNGNENIPEGNEVDLIAAINGLTRRNGPVVNGIPPAPTTVNQRIPSTLDFPALSDSIGSLVTDTTVVTPTPTSPIEEPVVAEVIEVKSEIIEPIAIIETPTSPVVLGEEFTVIEHSDAVIPAPVILEAVVPVEVLPTIPTPAPVPAPKVFLSFAAAAGRGVAVAPIVPVVVAKKVVVPVKVIEKVESLEEEKLVAVVEKDGFVIKKSKKNKMRNVKVPISA